LQAGEKEEELQLPFEVAKGNQGDDTGAERGKAKL